jgi:hypothetical protein
VPSTLAMAAKAELESEAFQQAIIRMEESWIDRICSSAPHELDKREYAYRMLKMLGDFVDELKAMTSDDAHQRGRAEAAQLMK